MPANPYKVGVNFFNQVGSDWIAWGPDGKELILPDGRPAHFKIGREAREFLNGLRGDKKPGLTSGSITPGRRLGKDEIHPDFVSGIRDRAQVDTLMSHLVSCRWKKLGDLQEDDFCRLVSPEGLRVYVHVGNRKLDRYFCWATSDDGTRIKDFDFLAVKPSPEESEEKKTTVEETVAEHVASSMVLEPIKADEVEKQDETI